MLLDEVIDVMPALDAQYGPATSMSINVSARQAVDVQALRRIVERLPEPGRPARFVIEVPEDAYLPAGVFQSEDRKRGVWGKGWSVCVEFGGSRIITKNKTIT